VIYASNSGRAVERLPPVEIYKLGKLHNLVQRPVTCGVILCDSMVHTSI
jgi:hypothetical protein